MGVYIFSNPNNPAEVIEIVQGMKEDHIFIKDGVKWNREWTNPNTGIDTKINPHSAKDFVEKTSKKRGNLGNLFDASKEMSLKRGKEIGKDPVKEQYWKNWSKKRGDRPVPEFLKNKS